MSHKNKQITPYLSFNLVKFNKYLPKFLLQVHISQTNPSSISCARSSIRNLVKCKQIKGIVPHEQVITRTRARNVNYLLFIVKNSKKSLRSFPLPLSENSYYKNLPQLQTLEIIDNNWLAWRAMRYCSRIKSLAFIDSEETEPSLKLDLSGKERYLKSFLRDQKCLQFISFKVDLKLEYYRYLGIIEGIIHQLKSLKGITLDLKLQVSGLSISKQKLPKLFKYIHIFQISEPSHYLLKLTDSGELDWLRDPKVLPNLRKISIKLKNDMPNSWRLLQNIQNFNLLQEFCLILHKPDASLLQHTIHALTLPKDLQFFTLKISGFDLSHLIEGEGWPEKRPFETDCLFSSFFFQISKAVSLKSLSLHLQNTNFKSFYADLVIGLVNSTKNLKELEIVIQEDYQRNDTFANESFMIGLILKSFPLEKLRLEARNIYLDKSFIETSKLNNIKFIEIIGNVMSYNNEEGIELLLKLVNPEKLILKQQLIATQEFLQKILCRINKMNKLVIFELEFNERSLKNEAILIALKDNLRRDIKATISFKVDIMTISAKFLQLINHLSLNTNHFITLTYKRPYLEYFQEGMLSYKSVFCR